MVHGHCSTNPPAPKIGYAGSGEAEIARMNCFGELVAEGIERIIDAGCGTRAVVKDNRPIHSSAAMIREVRFRDFKIFDLESDVISPKIAIARRPLVSVHRLIVLKQLKHQIWSDADHRDR
jgi:hypothetical protein